MVIEECILGTIEFTDNNLQTWNFTEKDIVDNDLTVTQQCMNESSFSLGGTYATTLNVTLHIHDILDLDGNTYTDMNIYNMRGSKITITRRVKVNGVQSAPDTFIGIFWITSATKYKDVYTLSCSDALVWLDSDTYQASNTVDENGNYIDNNYKYVSALYSRLEGTINSLKDEFNIVIGFVNDCISGLGIELQSTFDIGSTINKPPPTNGFPATGYCTLPNDVTGENATHCPRDYASWLSQIACGFVYCDYSKNDDRPNIIIYQLGYGTAFEINEAMCEDDTLEVADFTIKCDKVYVEIYDGATGASLAETKTLNSFTLDVSGNPFIDGHYQYREVNGDRNTLDILCYIFDRLKLITIRPFKCVVHNQYAYYRIGRKVNITKLDGSTYESIITKVVWNFRGGFELSCAGEDTRIIYDTARRTPSRKAKEQAISKANYLANELNKEFQSKIEQQNSAFQSDLTSQWNTLQGQIGDLGSGSNDLAERISNIEGNISDLYTRVQTLEGQVSYLLNN